jgi:hypothetical protein
MLACLLVFEPDKHIKWKHQVGAKFTGSTQILIISKLGSYWHCHDGLEKSPLLGFTFRGPCSNSQSCPPQICELQYLKGFRKLQDKIRGTTSNIHCNLYHKPC